MRQIFWARTFQRQGALASISEEGDLMGTAVPQAAQTGPETRTRQPESKPECKPVSEPVDRNVRPRLVPEREEHRTEDVESSQPTTQAAGGVLPAAARSHRAS